MSSTAARANSATALLMSAESDGSGDTLRRLIPLIYDELREMAHRALADERPDRTLHTTALVHEAYLRLVDQTQMTARGPAYFFAAAAKAMRRILIEHARWRNAAKRGYGKAPLSLDEHQIAVNSFATELLDLDNALNQLSTLNPRQAHVVECRFFAGLSIDETAAALNISPRTVRYDWTLARAWLYQMLRGTDPPDG